MECRNWRQSYREQAQQARDLCRKKIDSFFLECEQVRKKAQIQDKISEKMRVLNSQFCSVEASNAKILKETNEILVLNSECGLKSKYEKQSLNELYVQIGDMKKQIEERDKMTNEEQDKAGVLLKPYNDCMGITIEKSGSERSIRILFRAQSNKKCELKLVNKENKLKIVKAVPMLENLQDVEDYLNAENNFASFIVFVHSQFMKLSLKVKQ